MKTFGLVVTAAMGSKFERHAPALLADNIDLGQIHRCGDSHPRGLLYEAATVLLTRSRSECDLRKWELRLRERLGFKRAAGAVARKLAVMMHSMLITGEPFRERSAAARVPELVRVARRHETPCRDVG